MYHHHYVKKHRQKNKYSTFGEKQESMGSKNNDRILDSIFKSGLHQNRNYVALFGIVITPAYLNDSENQFRMAFLRKIDELKFQPQQSFNFQYQLNIFHKDVGLLFSCQSFWKKFVDIQTPMSAICALRLYSSNPVNQFRTWMNIRIYNIFTIYCQNLNFYDRNVIKDKYNKLIQSNIVNQNIFVEVSKICGRNFMIHKNDLPSRDPLLICGGEIVARKEFPTKDIFHLFTQDDRLFYEVGFKYYQQKLMNEYIHQEQANIIYLNQDKQAQRILENVIHSEQLEQKKNFRAFQNIWAQGFQPQYPLFQQIKIEDEKVKQEQIKEKLEEKIEEKIEQKMDQKIEYKIEEKIEEKIEDVQVHQNTSKEIKLDQVQQQDGCKYGIANQFNMVDKDMMNPIIEQLLTQCLEDDYIQGPVQFKGTGITQLRLGLNEEIRVFGYRFKFSFSTLKILLCENISLISKDNMEEENTIGYYDQAKEIWVGKQNNDI